MRVERYDRICGQAVLGKNFIYMERVDSALFCIADVDKIARQVFRQGQILGFGIEYNYPRIVRPLVCYKRF